MSRVGGGSQQVRIKDAADYPTRAAQPHNRELSAQNVNSGEAEKARSREHRLRLMAAQPVYVTEIRIPGAVLVFSSLMDSLHIRLGLTEYLGDA